MTLKPQQAQQVSCDRSSSGTTPSVGRRSEVAHPLQALAHRPRYEGGLPRAAGGAVDYKQDFFGKPAYLTVSGQLQVGFGPL